MTIDGLKSLLEGATSFLDWKRGRRDQKKKTLDEAQTAFRDAVTETMIYMGALRRAKRNHKTEAHLARLWSTACQRTRVVGDVIADSCFELSCYWANPPDDFATQLWQLDRLVRNFYYTGTAWTVNVGTFGRFQPNQTAPPWCLEYMRDELAQHDKNAKKSSA